MPEFRLFLLLKLLANMYVVCQSHLPIILRFQFLFSLLLTPFRFASTSTPDKGNKLCGLGLITHWLFVASSKFRLRIAGLANGIGAHIF